jgi:endonuclease YncB( thermonuclease family)
MQSIRENILPAVVGLCLLGIVGTQAYQYWQKIQAARPDYEQPSASEPPAGVVNGADQIQMPQTERWEVVSVTDGDTIAVRQGTRQEKIRFCGIDAPEIAHGSKPGQPYGEDSKTYLEKLIGTTGGKVGVVPVERDRYGRMVAEVFLLGTQEKLIQEELLSAGLAYVYPQYVRGCWNGSNYWAAEAIAQEKKVGVWSGQPLQSPWEFRRAMRER